MTVIVGEGIVIHPVPKIDDYSRISPDLGREMEMPNNYIVGALLNLCHPIGQQIFPVTGLDRRQPPIKATALARDFPRDIHCAIGMKQPKATNDQIVT